MADENSLTFLIESDNPVQTAMLKSLLQAHEIGFVVQGEVHSGLNL